jgi:hypothetical protein
MDHPAYQSTQSTLPTSDEALASMPPQKPSGRNWKKWIYIFVAILLVITAGGTFVLSKQQTKQSQERSTSQPTAAAPSPTPDPTTDWKTYTNSEYNFSFKYPPQYSVTPLTETKKSYNNGNPLEITEFGFPFSLGKMFNGASDQSGFILEIRPTLGKTIAEEYGNSPALGGGRVEVTYLSETGGAEEAAIIRPSSSGRVYRAGNYFYLVSSIQNIIGDDSTYINLEEIYKTFKFIDPLPSVTSKDPKTACEQNGGKWLANYNECEAASGGLDESTCKEHGGSFNECDSACRHDPNAQGCIEVCINVCKF